MKTPFFPIIALSVLIACPQFLQAQQPPGATDHSAHHPPAKTAPSSEPASATPGDATPGLTPAPSGSITPNPMGRMPAATTGNMGGMNGMMQGCAGSGCSPILADPLMSSILTLSPQDDAKRQELAAESHRRMDEGALLAAEAAKEAQAAASMRDAAAVERTVTRLREAHALFESGAAAHLALLRGADAPLGALDWYRAQMRLPAPELSATDSILLGATPAHLLLMVTLAVLAAALIGLQLLRRSRVKTLLTNAPASSGHYPPDVIGPRVQQQGAAAAETAAPEAVPQVPQRLAAIGAGQRWSGQLRVAQVVRETPTVSTFRLVDPAGDALPFGFSPGQFLQVEVDVPSGPVKRSYTIASSPTQKAYVELTVKREAQGVVSAFLHANVKENHLLKVAGPFGVFTFNGSDADSIVLIAGGVGITPMMSVLRYLTDRTWPGDIFFIYSARSPEEVVFRDEIEHLERRHPKLHTLVLVESRPAGTSWLGPEGRLTRELIQNEVPNIGARRVHLCGPPPMMTAMKKLLTDLGVPEAQIKSEAFSPASLPTQPPQPEDAAPAPSVAPADDTPREVAPATVTFSIAGVAAALAHDQTVLEAAESAGVDIPYSCRSGVCGVCVVKLARGNVTMATEEGLDPSDKAKGYVLACQAKSAGGDLVIEA